MSPYQKIRQKYVDTPQEEAFEFYVEWHHKHAFVFSTPNFFIMGRPVIMRIFDPKRLDLFSPSKADAWFIHAMAGDIPRVWSVLPWELPFIGWERTRSKETELQFHPIEVLKRLCSTNE